MMISTTCMELSRSLASPGLACELQHREQLNQVIRIVITIKIMLIIILMAKVTHWLDGSNIYGSTLEEAMYLRSSRGKLKISAQRSGRQGNLPSCQGETKGKVTGCDVCGRKKDDCFFAGKLK